MGSGYWLDTDFDHIQPVKLMKGKSIFEINDITNFQLLTKEDNNRKGIVFSAAVSFLEKWRGG